MDLQPSCTCHLSINILNTPNLTLALTLRSLTVTLAWPLTLAVILAMPLQDAVESGINELVNTIKKAHTQVEEKKQKAEQEKNSKKEQDDAPFFAVPKKALISTALP